MSDNLLDELDLGGSDDELTTTAAPAAAEKKRSKKSSPEEEAEGGGLKLTSKGTSNTGKGGYEVPDEFKSGKLEGNCAHCGIEMRNILGIMTVDGPVHNDCIPAYKRLRVERCGHCDNVLPPGKRSIVAGIKLHPECVPDFKAKKPYVQPSKDGVMRKFAVGRSFFGSKNWQTRFFSLSRDNGLRYWEKKEDMDAGKPPKGKVAFEPRTRLITHPTRQVHPEATNPSNHFIIVFYESPSAKKELMLVCECKGWQEHDEWTRVLETYIKIVDDPKDVKELP